MGLMTNLENFRKTGVGKWFRGEGQTEHPYPNLPDVQSKGRPVNWGMSLGMEDEANAFIFNKMTGGKLKVEKDRDGRPFVSVEGNEGLTTWGKPVKPGKYYLDRPGLDLQTWRVVASNLGLAVGTGGVASGLRMASRPIASAAARGAAQWGSWEGARQVGQAGLTDSLKNVSPLEITGSAAIGAAFGPLGPAVRQIKRAYGLRPMVTDAGKAWDKWRFPRVKRKLPLRSE